MVAAVGQSARVPEPAADPRLHQAAQEFEAMLLAGLLKMGNADGDDNGGADQSLHGYDDLRNQAVATALARDGGIGIGRMLIDKLAHHDPIKAFSSSADTSIAGICKGDGAI